MAETISMGIGDIGFSNQVFKRQFRFTFELSEICGSNKVSTSYVKVAARPHLAVEELAIDFLNQKIWIPGKAAWQTLTVTYFDVANIDIQPLYNWLASVYDFSNSATRHRQGSIIKDYSATGVLKLWDGCGSLLETWVLTQVWPVDVDFGSLDFASSEECNITLTLRYNDVSYYSTCPEFIPKGCCTPCVRTRGDL